MREAPPARHEFLVTTYAGTYAEIGRRAGASMRGSNYPYLEGLWENFAFPEATAAHLRETVALLLDVCPPILEEMLGFCDGAGIESHRILAALSGVGFNPPLFPGCSMAAILPERSGVGPLVARTYDFTDDPRVSESRLSLIHPAGGTATLGTAEFIFGRLEGMNERGLFVGIAYAHGRGEDRRGLYFPMIARAVLEMHGCARDAGEVIRRVPHTGTFNFLVADPREAFVVEAAPGAARVREPEGGLLFATNHYLHPEMAAHQRRVPANSRFRAETVARFFAERPRAGRADLEQLVSGHGGGGVCLHRYRFMLGTLWSAVFDLGRREAGYTAGPACLNPRFTIPFAERPVIERRIPMNLGAS